MNQYVSTLIPPTLWFLGPRKWPRIWKPRTWRPLYVVKGANGTKIFPKVPFLQVWTSFRSLLMSCWSFSCFQATKSYKLSQLNCKTASYFNNLKLIRWHGFSKLTKTIRTRYLWYFKKHFFFNILDLKIDIKQYKSTSTTSLTPLKWCIYHFLILTTYRAIPDIVILPKNGFFCKAL